MPSLQCFKCFCDNFVDIDLFLVKRVFTCFDFFVPLNAFSLVHSFLLKLVSFDAFRNRLVIQRFVLFAVLDNKTVSSGNVQISNSLIDLKTTFISVIFPEKIRWSEFFFLKMSMTRRVRVCWIVGRLNNTNVRVGPRLCSPQNAGTNLAAGHNFYVFRDDRWNVPILYWQKWDFFRLNLMFFDKWALFQPNPKLFLSRPTKIVHSDFFRTSKQFFDLSKKPKKV